MELSTYYSDLLNPVVNGKIENYEIQIDERKLKGENYLGEIVFVDMRNKDTKEELHLIVKRSVEDMASFTYLKGIYIAEINFYEQIWPILNKFQENVGFNKIPKCYASCRTKKSFVLENLTNQDFRLLDKKKTVDREHFDVIFKSYGVFHAISYAFSELHPEEFLSLESLTSRSGIAPTPDTTPEERKGFNTFYEANLHNVITLFDEEEDKDILNAYKNFVHEEPSKMVWDSIHYTGDSPMLIHGDCWSNNMMFKYDEDGKVIDIRFLDFQMNKYGSPVNDLSYCLYSGASKDILDKSDDLLRQYIDSFQETLKKLNCSPRKPYTFEKLKSEWKHYSKYGLILGIIVWSLKFVDKNYIPDFGEGGTPGFSPIAEEYVDVYKQRLRELVTHYYENDLF